MVAVRFPATLVTNPLTGLPLLEARGAVGNIVAEGTNTPLPITSDAAGNSPIQQPVTITPGGYVPRFWNQNGLTRATFVPLSGTWSTELYSPQGLEEAAAASAAAAEASRQAALAAAKPLVPGANITITPKSDGTLEVASTATSGSTTATVDGIQDAQPVGKAVLKAADKEKARAAMDAGTSNVAAAWTATGLPTGTPLAAPAAEAFRKTGTTRQTVAAPVTFEQPPVVPADSFTQDRIVGAVDRFTKLENRREIWVIDTPTSPLPAGYKTGDVLLSRTAPTTGGSTGGGGTTEPPAPITTYRRHRRTGVASGSVLTLAGGTNDTALDSISGTAPTITVDANGVREVILPNNATAGPSWRDTSVAPGTFAPGTAEFSISVGLRVIAYPTTTTTFLIIGNVLQFTQSTAGNINLTTSTGTFVTQSGAVPIDGIYTLKAWRGTTGNTEVRLYAPDGSTFWTTSRDLGTAIPSTWIRGRTGTAGGSLAFSNELYHNVTGELA